MRAGPHHRSVRLVAEAIRELPVDKGTGLRCLLDRLSRHGLV